MAKVKSNIGSSTEMPRIRPALTPESREQQMIALAVDLVEQRLLNGTASSQETTHYLKLGSMKNKLEMEKIKRENELLAAKTKAIESGDRIEKLYQEAITAMQRYSGHGESDEQ